MKINKLKHIGVFVVIIIITIVSCDDEVTLPNLNSIVPETFFTKRSDIEAASAAAYTHLQTQGLYQRYGYIIPDLMSDEMVPSGDENFLPPYAYDLSATNSIVEAYWQSCYKGILIANYVIRNEATMRANLTAVSDYSETDINQAVGEGHFMRGLYYYFLVKRYGGVPMPLSDVEVALSRSSEEAVYNQIISDFEQASLKLLGKEDLPSQRARACKGAALGMLGKVNLHRNNLQAAKDALDAITGYSLLPAENYTDNFNVAGEFNDQESMFEVNFTNDNDDSWAGQGEGLNEITFHAQEYAGWGNARPSQKIIDEFEADDPRKQLSILEDGETHGPTDTDVWGGGTVWFKYSDLYENSATVPESTTNTRILRYADVILMKAEVANKMGDDSSAIEYLNEIRNRFSLPLYGSAEMDARGYPVTTSDEVFAAIVHERMVELCGEQHRFDDLVRWGLDAVELQVDDSGVSRGYNPDVHKFIPIPQKEIDVNPNLTQADQNPGY